MLKETLPDLPADAPKKGEVYKHYKKDDRYEIVGLAVHSGENIWMVIYKPLYDLEGIDMFARPLTEWSEEVSWEGEIKKRFSPNFN